MTDNPSHILLVKLILVFPGTLILSGYVHTADLQIKSVLFLFFGRGHVNRSDFFFAYYILSFKMKWEQPNKRNPN